MTAADATGLGASGAALGAIVLLIAVARLPPFLAIGGGAALFALLAGVPPDRALAAFRTGAGEVEGAIGFVLALGAVLGAVMTRTGGADRIARVLLEAAPPRVLPVAVAAVAMLIGLPLFFEVGLVVLMPLLLALAARSGRTLLSLGMPALAGLTALHALVPPHPGPVLAAGILGAPLGATLGLGLPIAAVAVVLGGLGYGALLARRLGDVARPPLRTIDGTVDGVPVARSPSLAAALIVLLLPVALMLGRALVGAPGDAGSRPVVPPPIGATLLRCVGDPTVALALAVLAAFVLLGRGARLDRSTLAASARAGLEPIASLLLTIGAGGGLKGLLVAAGLPATIDRVAQASALPPPLLAWLIAALFRQATGSATVATAATAALLAPTLHGVGAAGFAAPLLVLAIGAGSVFFCQLNDAAFWMVREFFGLPLGATVLVWSVLQSIVSLTGLAAVLALWPFLRA